MRPPILRASFDPSDLVVDSFAGGGGASNGIRRAIGRDPDIAINHDAEAIAMHAANHPATKHYREDIWAVDPREACSGRNVGIAWFSPDCTHFSRARGGKPRRGSIRSLAWVVTRWARAVRPRVIFLENVEEIQTWGPLTRDGQPDPARAGRTFRAWVSQLRNLGYAVEWRSLVAADFGAATTRRRLYLVARCDGLPIVWPQPTHGRGRAPWRHATEIIDWLAPVRSIFGRQKPLAEATERRIAAGVQRYVIDAATPLLAPIPGLLAVPTLVTTGYGERPGQAPRVPGLDKPLGTVVNGQKHGLVLAFLTKHFGGVVGHELTRPIGTVTARDHHALTTVSLGAEHERVRAWLVKYYGSSPKSNQQSLFEPLHTVTSKARFGLVTVHGQEHPIEDIGMRMLAPRELFRAQGFPDSYQIDIEFNGKPLTKTAQIRLAGNSVCEDVAAALVAANVRQESVAAA